MLVTCHYGNNSRDAPFEHESINILRLVADLDKENENGTELQKCDSIL